jgi:hypothetical protein
MRIMELPSQQRAAQALEVAGCMRVLMLGGNTGTALDLARAQSKDGPAKLIERAGVTDVIPLVGIAGTTFIGSLAPYGFLARAESDNALRRVGFSQPVAVQTASLIAGTRALGAPIPLSSFALAGDAISRNSVGVIIVATREWLKAVSGEPEALLSRLARAAISIAQDQFAFDALTKTGTPDSTVAEIGDAISIVIEDLAVTPTSRPYLVFSPAAAKLAAGRMMTGGGLAFPQMGINGGYIGPTPCIVSGALSGQTIAAIDADSVLLAAGEIELSASVQAAIEMLDTPVGGAQQLVSLWQSNSAGVRATREIGVTGTSAACISRATISGT